MTFTFCNTSLSKRPGKEWFILNLELLICTYEPNKTTHNQARSQAVCSGWVNPIRKLTYRGVLDGLGGMEIPHFPGKMVVRGPSTEKNFNFGGCIMCY